MEVEILHSDKESVELKIDNITVAEVLRNYLNEQGIKFAAWRRDHPEKPIIFRIESLGKTVKKSVADGVSTIKKELSVLSKLVRK